MNPFRKRKKKTDFRFGSHHRHARFDPHPAEDSRQNRWSAPQDSIPSCEDFLPNDPSWIHPFIHPFIQKKKRKSQEMNAGIKEKTRHFMNHSWTREMNHHSWSKKKDNHRNEKKFKDGWMDERTDGWVDWPLREKKYRNDRTKKNYRRVKWIKEWCFIEGMKEFNERRKEGVNGFDWTHGRLTQCRCVVKTWVTRTPGCLLTVRFTAKGSQTSTTPASNVLLSIRRYA